MNDKLRLFPIGFLALCVTLLSFLYMSLLTRTPSKAVKSLDIDTTFSMVEEIKPVQEVKPDKPITPIQETQAQPPAMPKLDLQFDQPRPTVTLPQGLAKPKLDMIDPTFNPDAITTGDFAHSRSENQSLVPLVMIEPMYPIDATIEKIEGWVKVRFNINEQGNVTKAVVIEAQPRRVFDRATLKAVYKAQFKPLIVDGKPQATTAEQIIEFKLPKNASN